MVPSTRSHGVGVNTCELLHRRRTGYYSLSDDPADGTMFGWTQLDKLVLTTHEKSPITISVPSNSTHSNRQGRVGTVVEDYFYSESGLSMDATNLFVSTSLSVDETIEFIQGLETGTSRRMEGGQISSVFVVLRFPSSTNGTNNRNPLISKRTGY